MTIFQKIDRLIEEVSLEKKAQNAKFLYHGSPHKIDKFKLMKSRVIDNEKAIFAAPREFAVLFLNEWRDDDIIVGTVNGKIVIEERPNGKSAEEIFKKGGWLYKFDKKTFKKDKRLGPYELISKVIVPYESKEYIPSAMEEIKKYNIKIIRKDTKR